MRQPEGGSMEERRGRDPAASATTPNGARLDDRSMSDLLTTLSDQTTTLVRQEIELAKAEMTAKGKQVGIGAGAFGAAGVVGLYAVGAITACLILALSTPMAGWVAAPVVGGGRT